LAKGRNWTPTYSALLSSINLPNGYHQLLVRSDGKLAAYIRATTDISVDPATTALATNTWYHVVLTYDSVNGLKLYLNGVQDGSAAGNGVLIATGTTTWITNDSGTAGRFLAGSMDDVRIYRRALTVSEVVALYRDSQRAWPGTLKALASPFARQRATYQPWAHGGQDMRFAPL